MSGKIVKRLSLNNTLSTLIALGTTEDKKFITLKWCIREKFRLQMLGVTKGFIY